MRRRLLRRTPPSDRPPSDRFQGNLSRLLSTFRSVNPISLGYLRRSSSRRSRLGYPSGWRPLQSGCSPSGELTKTTGRGGICQPSRRHSIPQSNLALRGSKNSDEIVVLLALANDEELTFDGLIRSEPKFFVGDAAVVHVDSAATDQSSRVALRARHARR
jgi:hypothetical protein